MIDINLPTSDATTFFHDIEDHVTTSNVGYMEAIIHWSELRGIELEYLASLIEKNAPLKAKIQCEAENLNFIKKSKRIPI